MRGYLQKTLFWALSTLFVLAPASQVAQAHHEEGEGRCKYCRLAANTRGFVAGDEISVTARALAPDMTTPFANGGVVIYDKTVRVPENLNVLFITISATGDVHGGARMLLGCLVDGKSCVQSKIPNGAPDGWVTLQRHKDYNENYAPKPMAPTFNGDGVGGAGDLHDNSVYYTWCTKIKKAGEHGAMHHVKIKMASQHVEDATDQQGQVSIEAVHFYIDGARLPKMDACTPDMTVIQ